MLPIPTASPACWATLLKVTLIPATENSYSTSSSLFTFPPREEAACGLLRFKFTIKMRFFFFPPSLPMISWWRVWHMCPPHKAYKWFLHGDEILHCYHSKNVCFEKNVLCSVNTSPTDTSLYICYWNLNFFFFVNADTYKVTSCGISVYI